MPRTRRTFIASCLLTAAMPARVVLGAAAQAPDCAGSDDITRLFTDAEDTIFNCFPEAASQLGVDIGARAELRSKLAGRSHADRDRFIDQARCLRDRAKRALDQGSPNAALQGLHYWLDAKVRSKQFPTWDETSQEISPYALSQLTGAYQQYPDFLNNHHPILTPRDVEAFVLRLEAFARAIDEDTARAREDAGRGVVAPDFALAKMVGQLLEFRALQTDQEKNMAAILAHRAEEANIPAGRRAEAQKVLVDKILPAIDRQLDAMDELRPHATHDAGVWRIPDGPDFYREALRQNLTTEQTPDEIHELGLELVKKTTAELDTNLKNMNLTQGTLGERLRKIYDDTSLSYQNTVAGKAEVKRKAEELMDEIIRQLPQAFRVLPMATRPEVKFVPAYL